MGYILVKKLESASSYNRCLFYVDHGEDDLPDPATGDFAAGSIAECLNSGLKWILDSKREWILQKYPDQVLARIATLELKANDVKIYPTKEEFPLLFPEAPYNKFLEDKIFVDAASRITYRVVETLDEGGHPTKQNYERIWQDIQFVASYNDLPSTANIDLRDGLLFVTLDDMTIYYVDKANNKYKRLSREVKVVDSLDDLIDLMETKAFKDGQFEECTFIVKYYRRTSDSKKIDAIYVCRNGNFELISNFIIDLPNLGSRPALKNFNPHLDIGLKFLTLNTNEIHEIVEDSSASVGVSYSISNGYNMITDTSYNSWKGKKSKAPIDGFIYTNYDDTIVVSPN